MAYEANKTGGYRIQLNKGNYEDPHYYTRIDKKNDTADYSPCGFWRCKHIATAMRHLEMIYATGSQGVWTIEKYEVGK